MQFSYIQCSIDIMAISITYFSSPRQLWCRYITSQAKFVIPVLTKTFPSGGLCYHPRVVLFKSTIGRQNNRFYYRTIKTNENRQYPYLPLSDPLPSRKSGAFFYAIRCVYAKITRILKGIKANIAKANCSVQNSQPFLLHRERQHIVLCILFLWQKVIFCVALQIAVTPFWIDTGGQNLLRINVPLANPGVRGGGSRLKNQSEGQGERF